MKSVSYIIIKYRYRMIAIGFWILTWQLISMCIDNSIFLASPGEVIISLFHLIGSATFWVTITNSFVKIASGFLLAVILGVMLAIITYRYLVLKEVTIVFMQTIKSIPVASFVILALLWVKAVNLSILIAFLMVLPIVYTNVMQGISSTSTELLEMAEVFRIPVTRKFRYIYLPAVTPYFVSACSISLGFCWKSGIAAEVISLARNSIGERLYEAKLYLNTKELFAWTIVIVIISVIFEKLVMRLIRLVSKRITMIKEK